MSYFPKPGLNENDLAIIERGDTAAHSIEAGRYVSWHGKIGKAKAAILQGATLDSTLFDYDEDGILNSSEDVESGSSGGLSWRRRGNVVTVSYLGDLLSCGAWSYRGVGTIPESCASPNRYDSPIWGNVPITAGVTISGTSVGIWCRDSGIGSSGFMGFTVTYSI